MPQSKERHREYTRNWLRKRREWAIDFLGGKCYRCGSTKDLQFDHINPASGDRIINSLLSSMDLLIIELAKCQLLCVDCHREKAQEDNARKILDRANAERGNRYAGDSTDGNATIMEHSCT